jgi:DNA-binding winged helix-turn-helix (wHTH) protein
MLSKSQVCFGPFTLTPSERLLQRDGQPVRLGGRAFDILVALVESPGKTIRKTELIARVWPGMVVEEGSLRFHMVAVRKALGDGEDGKRYIVNTANLGYTFVASVTHPERLSQDVNALLDQHIDRIGRQIAELRALQDELSRLRQRASEPCNVCAKLRP